MWCWIVSRIFCNFLVPSEASPLTNAINLSFLHHHTLETALFIVSGTVLWNKNIMRHHIVTEAAAKWIDINWIYHCRDVTSENRADHLERAWPQSDPIIAAARTVPAGDSTAQSAGAQVEAAACSAWSSWHVPGARHTPRGRGTRCRNNPTEGATVPTANTDPQRAKPPRSDPPRAWSTGVPWEQGVQTEAATAFLSLPPDSVHSKIRDRFFSKIKVVFLHH